MRSSRCHVGNSASVCGILCGQQKSAKPYSFKKLPKSKENTRNPKISGVVLELLTRFELVTSSLPTTVEPSSPCCIRLCGGFLSKKDEVAACLFHCFRPLISPCGSRCGSKQLSGRERGAHLRQRQAEPHQMPVWFCSYPYKTSSRRESSKIAYRRFCQKRSSKLKLSHSYFSFQKRTAVIKEYADTLAF